MVKHAYELLTWFSPNHSKLFWHKITGLLLKSKTNSKCIAQTDKKTSSFLSVSPARCRFQHSWMLKATSCGRNWQETAVLPGAALRRNWVSCRLWPTIKVSQLLNRVLCCVINTLHLNITTVYQAKQENFIALNPLNSTDNNRILEYWYFHYCRRRRHHHHHHHHHPHYHYCHHNQCIRYCICISTRMYSTLHVAIFKNDCKAYRVYQSGTKPKLVAKILATNFGLYQTVFVFGSSLST